MFTKMMYSTTLKIFHNYRNIFN